MVGSIEPLDFKELTNVKEHQAIIAKINEIIAAIEGQTINDARITLKQGSQVKGSFTTNQATDDTIVLDAGGSAGGFVWGEGTGTITAQTDLVNLVTEEVGAEATARAAAIASLEGTIASEATMRETADDTLEAEIAALDADIIKKSEIKTTITDTLTDEDVLSGKAIYDGFVNVAEDEFTKVSPLPSGVTYCVIKTYRVGKILFCEPRINVNATVNEKKIAAFDGGTIIEGDSQLLIDSTTGALGGRIYTSGSDLYLDVKNASVNWATPHLRLLVSDV